MCCFPQKRQHNLFPMKILKFVNLSILLCSQKLEHFALNSYYIWSIGQPKVQRAFLKVWHCYGHYQYSWSFKSYRKNWHSRILNLWILILIGNANAHRRLCTETYSTTNFTPFNNLSTGFFLYNFSFLPHFWLSLLH